MRHSCAVRPEDLGPYLLDQLDPDEAARVVEAVASCPTCTVQVERLRPVAAALARVSIPLDDEAPAPSASALERMVASLRAEQTANRRRLRARITMVAAAAVLVVGVVAGAIVIGSHDGSGQAVTLTGDTSATGTAIVSPKSWGSEVALDVRGLTPGKTYGAWLADGNGDRVPAGTFRALADGSASLELGASLSPDRASTIGVTLIGGPDVLTAKLGS